MTRAWNSLVDALGFVLVAIALAFLFATDWCFGKVAQWENEESPDSP